VLARLRWHFATNSRILFLDQLSFIGVAACFIDVIRGAGGMSTLFG